MSRWAKTGVVTLLLLELAAVVFLWGPGRNWPAQGAKGGVSTSSQGASSAVAQVSALSPVGADQWVLWLLAIQRIAGSPLAAGSATEETAGSAASTGQTGTATAEAVRITVAAAGDFLMHLPIVECAATGEGYEFNPVFVPVQSYLESADFTVVNLETRLAGAEFGYSGYPQFNTPEELARDIREMGVDLVATANNHSMDMGAMGVFKTLDHLDAAGVAHVGTARSAAEQAVVPIMDVNGVRIAFLNATSSLNGVPLPSEYMYAVDLLDTKVLLTQAQTARAQGADVVIAVLHWGEEYSRTASDEQREVAYRLLKGGVDVIIGSHPHVVEPIQRLTVERNGRPFTTYVAYSLGNFVSNQRDRYRDSGIVLFVDIEKSAEGVSIVGVRYLPVWVQKATRDGRACYRVLPVHPAIEPQSDLPLNSEDKARMAQVWEELNELLANPTCGITSYWP